MSSRVQLIAADADADLGSCGLHTTGSYTVVSKTEHPTFFVALSMEHNVIGPVYEQNLLQDL